MRERVYRTRLRSVREIKKKNGFVVRCEMLSILNNDEYTKLSGTCPPMKKKISVRRDGVGECRVPIVSPDNPFYRSEMVSQKTQTHSGNDRAV